MTSEHKSENKKRANKNHKLFVEENKVSSNNMKENKYNDTIKNNKNAENIKRNKTISKVYVDANKISPNYINEDGYTDTIVNNKNAYVEIKKKFK